ncbi:MAG TPA: Nif3-like dinuclear metal center hexameric protein [Peptococcaceae bacterium]|nr:Nif3-like dinuclear metal center hexameric protein [Peptococcaceae bacterium]
MTVSVGQVEQLIEKVAPRSWAEDWDNPGLLVGSSAQRVNKILLALDVTPEVIDEAVQEKADLLIAHHPLMFKPLKNLRMDNQAALLPLALFRHGISFYAAHTNLDQSVLSSSRTFSKILGLEQTEYLEITSNEKFCKIVTFVPEENVETVRQVLAAEGVGSGITDGEHSENYSDCFYQTKGEGMFRALSGADPTIGEIGELTRVPEIRLESVVSEKNLARAVKALLRAHPYEEPAYDLIPLKNTGKPRGYGMIGYLPKEMTLADLLDKFLATLHSLQNSDTGRIFPYPYDLSSIRTAGDWNRKIKKVAIVNGSGNSFVQKAVFKGADLFITGDIDYHGVLDALQAGMAVCEMGHFLSEIPMIQSLYAYLRQDKAMADVEMVISFSNKVPWGKRG